MMHIGGIPLQNVSESLWYMLVVKHAPASQGHKGWMHVCIWLQTWRYWKPQPPRPPTIFDLLSWRALLRAVDKATDRALTRLYFARSHKGRVMSIISEAIDVPVSPWGVIKPPYGDRIFRGEKGK